MKCLEIISLRTSGQGERDARKYMEKICRIVKKYNQAAVEFYSHASIPGDLALVIYSEKPEDIQDGTQLCLYVTDLLKQFGLVDYNCWLLEDNK
ncbi:MAG: hypothetical protein ABFD50_17060 [Smithella sp.]